MPALVIACASCLGSAFGDRTYNWPYYTLFAMPFLIAAAIGGVLAYYAGVRPRTLLRSVRPMIFGPFHRSSRGHEGRSTRTAKETT